MRIAVPTTRGFRRRVALLGLIAVVLLLVHPVRAHLRAASLLTRFTDAHATGFLANMERHAVERTDLLVQTRNGAARARLFLPAGVTNPPGMVLLHGVHHLGIEEPRLINFAQTIAATGVAVLTPEIREIADYHIDPASLETIGSSAHALRARVARPVGVMGMSFAGGLALVAAGDARYNADIGFVVAVGAHDDLPRVLRFFATDSIDRPDGSHETMHAHDYGPLVLVYSHIEDFFPAADLPEAREALRLWLWEDFDGARAHLPKLSPEARDKMQILFDHKVQKLAPELLAEIENLAGQMHAVSPHDHLKDVHVPVYLLHGAGDNVIPATETLWLAKGAPPAMLRDVLVSPAIQHVELEGEPTLADKWALVHFMSDVLGEAESQR